MPRYRHRETDKYGPDTLTKGYPVSCANRVEKPILYYPGNQWLGLSESIADEVTEHYFKLRKEGKELPFNPLVSSKMESRIFGSTTFRVTSVADACTNPAIKSWYQNEGAFLTANIWPTLSAVTLPSIVESKVVSNLVAEITTKALAGRQSGQANFAESLAELDKAFIMFGKPLENVRSFIRDFRRSGRLTNATRRADAESYTMMKFVSSEWLRFRYGITPLVADVRAAIKALERGYEPTASIHTSRASGNANDVSYSTSSFTGGGGAYRVRYQITSNASVSIRVMYRDEYRNSAWNNVGLSYHNILGLGWELTRLSFVVDWFVNVGDVIYGNIPRVGLVPRGGARTIKWTRQSVLSPLGLDSLTPTVQTVTGSVSDSCSVTHTELRRELPGYETELVIKGDFRLNHFNRAVDLIAIIMQQLGSVSFENPRRRRIGDLRGLFS